MPFLAPPLIALGTAVGTGATVAGGIGAVGLIAGGIGTVLSVAGMVTKNKLLGQLGMGFGIAGAVAGLGSMAAAGGLFGNTVTVGGNVLPVNQAGLTSLQGAVTPTVQVGSTAASNLPTGAGAVNPMSVGGQANIVGSTGLSQSGAMLGPVSPPAVSIPGITPGVPGAMAPGAGVMTPGSTGLASGGGLLQTPTAPASTAVGGTQPSTIQPIEPAGLGRVTGGPQIPTSTTGPLTQFNTGGNDFLVNSLAKQVNALPAGGVAGWFGALDPASKAILMNTVGQGVSGTVGGIFSSIQADRQAELLEQINRENRQYQKWQSEQGGGLIQFQQPQ